MLPVKIQFLNINKSSANIANESEACFGSYFNHHGMEHGK